MAADPLRIIAAEASLHEKWLPYWRPNGSWLVERLSG
jgi:hypothetical protein